LHPIRGPLSQPAHGLGEYQHAKEETRVNHVYCTHIFDCTSLLPFDFERDPPAVALPAGPRPATVSLIRTFILPLIDMPGDGTTGLSWCTRWGRLRRREQAHFEHSCARTSCLEPGRASARPSSTGIAARHVARAHTPCGCGTTDGAQCRRAGRPCRREQAQIEHSCARSSCPMPS